MRIASLLLPALVLISLAAHVVGFGLVGDARAHTARAPAMVEMTMEPAKPPPPPPPPTEAKPPAEVPKVPERIVRAARPAPAPRPDAPPPPPPTTSAPPPPEAPADFTGTTLTNSGGEAWAAATGNGEAMTGPVGPAGGKRGPRVQPGVAHGTGSDASAPPVVGLGDLSQAPRAPDLNDDLAHNYPAEARRMGLAGKAVVRARVGADGQVRVIGIASESATGFGEACRRTLQHSRWQPPLDKRGRPVTTELSYTCRFQVGT